jgi:hypothetical protein
MLSAAVLAVLSVLLGAALGLLGRRATSALGLVQAAAVGAGGAAVFGMFLPESFAAMGVAALAPFALGLFAPGLVDRASHAAHGRGGVVSFEIGYAGLLVHQVADGVTLGAYTGPSHAGHAHYEVLLSVAGHTVPVVAALVVGFAARSSTRTALVRAFGLATAVVVGIALAHADGAGAALAGHQGWVDAAAGGLVLHIVLHGLPLTEVRGARRIARHGAALLAGVLVVVAALRAGGGHVHHGDESAHADAQAHDEAESHGPHPAAWLAAAGLVLAAVVVQRRGHHGPAGRHDEHHHCEHPEHAIVPGASSPPGPSDG